MADFLADTVNRNDEVTTLREAIITANCGDSPSYLITFVEELDGSIIVLSWDDPADGDPDPNPLWIGNNDGTTINAGGLVSEINIDASRVTDAHQIASDYNRLIGLIILDARHHGVYIVGDSNFVEYCTVRGCSSEGGGSPDYGGVTVAESATDTNIEYCVIEENFAPGIIVDGAEDVEIIENTIQGNGLSGVGDYQSYLPPGFWDGVVNDNAPAGADKDQSIAFTPQRHPF